MKKISLLGATGSIGQQTLDVLRTHPEQFELVAFSVGQQVDAARAIAREFSVPLLSVANQADVKALQEDLPSTEVVWGSEGLVAVASESGADLLVNAVLGSVGLQPTLRAIEKGITIAIANKETLVTAGHLVMAAAKKHNVAILPVDSEHSALFQALNGENPKQIKKLVITASGGSFRDKTRAELEGVTVQDALNHPNWSMGSKITIDSATMMNKGLEVIEAHVLFDMPYSSIDVVLHRESIIHSMIEFVDTSVMAQLGTPDMRVPIQYALTYPDRHPLPQAKSLDLVEIGKLHFEKMDLERYKALHLAIEAGKEGGTATTVLNAANEAAVALFLQQKISFLAIDSFIEKALEAHTVTANPTLETILTVDAETRRFVEKMVH
ncbi:1-deoxy-D-xylulose-5-phosphate reductoisomerase [Chryseomicrobium aureum]|uniref:1-deoxy-D-xylulose-5-phosphate reductoisomerase n=1 Tax=Chryseomicrobium aureum TaxID=1441723 RepID=UPI001957E8A5|nr:1-deoxy-D-xylulose-5-phosphate reductoisomerase [Chryseomicrobium aureum]MBM7705408.1 1-deoxy-D-xylulose-5-phosphate reductoisomerase [Chryseomicrobium aureum]